MIELHVTFGDPQSAAAVARKALEARLAACANILPDIRSLYWWNGQITEEAETLMIFKTSETKASELAALVAENHPYDVPAIIRHDHVTATDDYLAWVDVETGTKTGAEEE